MSTEKEVKSGPFGRKLPLLNFMNDLKPPAQERFAGECETTRGQLRQIGYGNRPCSPVTAVAIDRESRGRVTYTSLVPDLDWSYIRKTIASRVK